MPRIAAEARSAMVPLTNAGGPRAPRGLSVEAKAHWREIVGSRPADFFSPGNLELLATYCRALVQLDRATTYLEDTPIGTDEYDDATLVWAKLNASVVVLATKLRLTIQSALRGDRGKNDERAKPAALLGGNVTALRRA